MRIGRKGHGLVSKHKFNVGKTLLDKSKFLASWITMNYDV